MKNSLFSFTGFFFLLLLVLRFSLFTVSYGQNPGSSCASAVLISMNTSTTSFDISAAPGLPQLSVCTNNPVIREGWFYFTAGGGTTSSIIFNNTGNVTGYIYIYSSACGSLTQISCNPVYAGNSAKAVLNTSASSKYFIRILQTEQGTLSGNLILNSCNPPETQANNITFSNITSNSLTVSWTNGNGDGAIVLINAAGPLNSDPVPGKSYPAPANPTAWDAGAKIGADNYVVYKGSGSSADITGLSSGTVYHFAVYSFFSSSNCYLLPASAACMSLDTYTAGTGDISGNQEPFSNSGDGGVNIQVSGNDVTVKGYVTMTSGTYNFRNFTINPGSLVSVTGTLPLVINCTGTAAIGGIFDLAGKNGYYNSNSCTATISYKAGGAGGEGGGGGGAPGGKGGDATINATTTTAGVAGTSFGSFSGGGKGGGKPGFGLVGGGGGGGGGGSYGDILGTNGGAGTDGSYAQAGGAGGLKGSSYGNAALTTVYNSSVLLGGSGGGGGGAVSGNPGRSSGAGGGGGGGAVGIYANDINLTNGLISVKGGNGGSGSVSANCKVSTDDFPAGGGGGGGSGGTVLLKYGESCISCNLGTNINISGGTGGTGVTWENEKGGNGGNGGNGRFLAQKAGSMPGRLTLSVNHTNFCAGDFQDITLSASGAGGATVNWYTGGCSGKLIGTGSQLSLTAPSSAITYYAAPAAATCNCTGIKVTVNKKPYVTSAPVTLTKNKGDSISFTVFSGGTPPFSYRWQHGSNIIPAASANSFRIKSVSCIDVGQYSCIISNTCGSITYLAATLSVNGCSGVKVSGTVRYNNKALKPMSASTNTSVFLKTTEDVTINTTATDENGNYSFSNILAGTYKLVCTTQLKWGGSSPLDALVINKSYIGTYTFTDALKLQAADVDLNSDITPADALAINKRFINLITLFKAPDWLFEVPVITVGSSDIIRDIKAICAGDADGSYNW